MKLARSSGDPFGPFTIALFEGTPSGPMARIVAEVYASAEEGETSARALADLFVKAPDYKETCQKLLDALKEQREAYRDLQYLYTKATNTNGPPRAGFWSVKQKVEDAIHHAKEVLK